MSNIEIIETPSAIEVATPIPEVLHFFKYNCTSINNDDNKVECKKCSSKISFKLGDPTSNLFRHLRSNPVTHADFLQSI